MSAVQIDMTSQLGTLLWRCPDIHEPQHLDYDSRGGFQRPADLVAEPLCRDSNHAS